MPLFEGLGAGLVGSTKALLERGVDHEVNRFRLWVLVLLEGGNTLIESVDVVASISLVSSDSGVSVGTYCI